MLRKPVEEAHEPIISAVNEIGDAWMLLILWAATRGVTRFDSFQKELGVARNILSERLRRLIDFGLLERRPISDGARRMEYRLTEKGLSLHETLAALETWGAAWSGRWTPEWSDADRAEDAAPDGKIRAAE